MSDITPAEAEILQAQVQQYGPIADWQLPIVLAGIRDFLAERALDEAVA